MLQEVRRAFESMVEKAFPAGFQDQEGFHLGMQPTPHTLLSAQDQQNN